MRAADRCGAGGDVRRSVHGAGGAGVLSTLPAGATAGDGRTPPRCARSGSFWAICKGDCAEICARAGIAASRTSDKTGKTMCFMANSLCRASAVDLPPAAPSGERIRVVRCHGPVSRNAETAHPVAPGLQRFDPRIGTPDIRHTPPVGARADEVAALGVSQPPVSSLVISETITPALRSDTERGPKCRIADIILAPGIAKAQRLRASGAIGTLEPKIATSEEIPLSKLGLSRSTVRQLGDTPVNRLLALLPPRDYASLRRHLKPIRLAYRQSLYRANKTIEYVYFIESGVGSLVNTMRNGEAAEVGTIGNEGMVGLPLILGDDRSPTSVYVQVPGSGLRMKSDLFAKALAKNASLRAVMGHYAHAFFNQVAQSAACNHFHSLEQRCSRWLLMTHDRMHSDEFLLTQEFLAMMLGRAAHRRDGGGGHAAAGRNHPLHARQRHDHRPARPRAAVLRMLRAYPRGSSTVCSASARPARAADPKTPRRRRYEPTAPPCSAGSFHGRRTVLTRRGVTIGIGAAVASTLRRAGQRAFRLARGRAGGRQPDL
ncbi:MAG: Crp/Fnr family transcriptional regulator [Rhizomicrobium sp.]